MNIRSHHNIQSRFLRFGSAKTAQELILPASLLSKLQQAPVGWLSPVLHLAKHGDDLILQTYSRGHMSGNFYMGRSFEFSSSTGQLVRWCPAPDRDGGTPLVPPPPSKAVLEDAIDRLGEIS